MAPAFPPRPARRIGRLAAWTALTALFCGLAGIVAPAKAQVEAATVKATFLYRFASFVTWPAPETPDAPVTLCVMEDAGLGARLARLVQAQSVDGRVFVVEQLGAADDIRSCSIAYLNGDEAGVRQLLRASAGFPVLTVTDAAITPGVRGVVHFVTVDNRVRFHIDDSQAAENRLRVDSRLLSLAVSVRRRG